MARRTLPPRRRTPPPRPTRPTPVGDRTPSLRAGAARTPPRARRSRTPSARDTTRSDSAAVRLRAVTPTRGSPSGYGSRRRRRRNLHPEPHAGVVGEGATNRSITRISRSSAGRPRPAPAVPKTARTPASRRCGAGKNTPGSYPSGTTFSDRHPHAVRPEGVGTPRRSGTTTSAPSVQRRHGPGGGCPFPHGQRGGPAARGEAVEDVRRGGDQAGARGGRRPRGRGRCGPVNRFGAKGNGGRVAEDSSPPPRPTRRDGDDNVVVPAGLRARSRRGRAAARAAGGRRAARSAASWRTRRPDPGRGAGRRGRGPARRPRPSAPPATSAAPPGPHPCPTPQEEPRQGEGSRVRGCQGECGVGRNSVWWDRSGR